MVELIIVVAIMGLIIVALGNLLATYFMNSSETAAKVAQSHDVELLNTYFSQDVSTLGTHASDGTYSTSVYNGSFPSGACGSTAASADQVLLILSDDVNGSSGSPTTTVNSVAYLITHPSSGPELHRYFCVSSTLKSDTTVVHNLSSTAPTIACNPAPCTTSPPPTTISMQVSILDSSKVNTATTVTLSGTRRQT